MFQELLEKIKTILQANTLLAHVQDWEEIQTDSDPFAIVVPSDNESDYYSTQENERIYAFRIMIFASRNKKIRSPSNAESLMKQLIDTILDDIDKDYDLSTLGAPVKTGYTFINFMATPSAWGYAMPDDQYRVATINVQARVHVDVDAIT